MWPTETGKERRKKTVGKSCVVFFFFIKSFTLWQNMTRGKNTKKEQYKTMCWMPVGQMLWHWPSSHVGKLLLKCVMWRRPNNVCTAKVLFFLFLLDGNCKACHILNRKAKLDFESIFTVSTNTSFRAKIVLHKKIYEQKKKHYAWWQLVKRNYWIFFSVYLG